MKTINVPFTDDEHQKLLEVKGDLNWHDFILEYKRPYDLGHELVMVNAKLEAIKKIAKGLSEDCDEFISNRGKQIMEILGESQKSAPKVKT